MDRKTPTQQTRMVLKELENFDSPYFFQILSLELEVNNIADKKAEKWMASILGVHEEEMETAVYSSDDLAEAVCNMLIGKETDKEYTIKTVSEMLQVNCSKMDSPEFNIISEAIGNMSALERKWFIRYWLRNPRSGISKGNVIKMISKAYKKKLAVVKKHTNFNSIYSTVLHYDKKEEPPCNLTFGKFIAPMLAKEMPRSRWPKKYIVDYKYDGNRYQIHKKGKQVMVFNRKGKEVTDKFPDVVELVSNYDVTNAIFDGEIYPVNPDGSPAEHKKMGTRVHSKNVLEAVTRVPVAWVMFDCLLWEEETIMDLPLSQRLSYFKHMPNQAHRVSVQDWDNILADADVIMDFYDEAIRNGFEGIIVKDADLAYEAGKRSTGWIKYKPPTVELDVVVLSVSYGTGNRQNVFGTYEIGVKSEDGFISVGKVGTGFSDADLVYLTGELRKQIISRKDGVFKVNPTIVLEVKSDLVTQDAKGNIGLRFPRMNRIREDKFVEDIDTLEIVMEKLK